MQDTVRRFVNSHINNELVRALSQDAKMLDHINERFAELLSTAKTQENKKASAETQGEAKFQKIGINKDGIEVYEISAETKRLPFKERKKHFLSLMKNEYRGRTAKFEKNGQVYYAAFEDADIQKNIYGDKKSDAKGYKAKINAGADGDIFDLVEKSKYNGSGKEIGKQTAAHKNISNWDYFIKTVQIGKGVFDLVANVRRRNNGAFVYSIQLNANKKTTASPPKVDNTATVKRVLNAVVNNSISNPDEIVKHFDEKNSSNPDEVVEPSDEEFSSGVKNQMSIDLAQDAEYSEYDKPITIDDVNVLRGIRRKSINDFTSEDIKKSQKWAYKFYKELGVKSPFFRAWFGDWRLHDKGEVVEVSNNGEKSLGNGRATNKDTGIVMSWNAHDISRETDYHAAREKISKKAIYSLPSIIENAILLDTYVSDNSSKSKLPNTAFMHSFYTVYKENNKLYLIKLYAEQALSNNEKEIFTRAYQLKDIVKVADLPNGVSGSSDPLSGDKSATVNSISELFDYVKRFDKDFHPKPVNPILLNKDGTPKVFYHGTGAEFNSFSPDEIGPREGSYFFAENIEEAQAYGKYVMPVYLTSEKLANYDEQPHEFYKLNNKREQLAYLKARGVWADPYQGDAKAAHMAAMDLSSLLLDALFDPNIVPARRTFADMEEEKRYRALLNQYSYYEKRMAKLNDRVRQARAEGRQAVKNERGRREAAIKEMAEHYAQMTYKAQERRKSSELKAKIARLADSMNGRLINPKKDRYIPQDIQQAIIPALELAANYTYGAERLEKYDRMIAAEPNEERRQRLIKTRDKIAKYGDNISSAIKDLKDLYDAGRPRTDSNGEELNADNPYDAAKQRAFNPAISELLNTVYNQLNGVSCKQMSSEQLQLLYNALRATDKVIRDSVNLRSSRIKMSVYEAGEELIRETSAIKGSKRGLASSLLQQNLNPESFFERLGGFAKNSLWMKTYDDLNDAQRDNKANQKRIAYRKRT